MTRSKTPIRRVTLCWVALAVALVTAGCFNPFSPKVLTERVVSVAPSATTPENAVRLFEWCWVNRGLEEYKQLFTDDYVFRSAALDSAGNGTRDVLTRRDDEIETAQNMFIGTAERPPASRIDLTFANLTPFPDTRPNHEGEWFKTIRTHVDLKVEIEEGNVLEVTGYALFYLARGDTAAIPPELKARGFNRVKTRWWISRWEDETVGSAIAAAVARRARPGAQQEVFQRSMLQVKRYYLGR